MRKFVFIGAGSLEFTRDLVRDLMTFESFDDAEIALVDIDAKRLDYARRGIEKVVKAGGHHATVTATTDRLEALPGADGVLITVLQGGVDVWRYDVEIPEKYGVDICVGAEEVRRGYLCRRYERPIGDLPLSQDSSCPAGDHQRC